MAGINLLKKQHVRLGANLSLLLLWVVLFRPVYPYLATIFTRQEFRTNQIALLAVLVLIVASVFIFVNFATDIAYAWLDPRMRHG